MINTPRTVFNENNTGYLTKRYGIFMDQHQGIYDTINIAYPELEELYLLQRSLSWTEDEVNLEQSRMDMLPIGGGGKTRVEEIDILKKVVSYLWEADSIASRSVLPIFAPYLSNSEATAMFTEHTRFEVIHAKTYSEIVRQCNMNSEEIIKQTVENENILSRTRVIVRAFDDLIRMGSLYNMGDNSHTKSEHRKAILRGLVSLYLLERVQFMSSFAVVFGLAEHDKFKGIADLVKLIARDELLHARMMSTVINIVRQDEDWDNDFNEILPEIYDMVDEVVKREFGWNEYLFSEGRTMVGLNASLLNDWVLFCTKDMCDKISIEYKYKHIKSNPITWVDGWLEFDKVQNANQEADNISYRMNAVDNDMSDDFIFDL